MKSAFFGILIFCLSEVSDCDASAGTSSASSGLGVRVTALLHERVGFEARAHTHLSHWCNATIPAQEQRRNALHHLLSQAQLLQTSESVTSAALSGLRAEVASLDKDIAEARLSSITTQSLHAKEQAFSHLSLEDATKDVDALQHTLNHLGAASAPANAAVKAAASLLAQAEESKHQLQKQVVLLQNSVDVGGNLSRVLASYKRKKAELAAYQQQYFTTQRSLDVLTSALEDESEYLADLHSICSAESSVHKRLEKQMSQSLSHKNLAAATQSTRPIVSQPVKVVASKSPAALEPVWKKKRKTTSEPVALKQKAESTAKSIIKAKPVAKKTAMLQDASKARSHARDEVTSKIVAKSVVVETHAKAQPKMITKDPFEDDDDVEVASEIPDKTVSMKSKAGKKVAPILQQTTKAGRKAVERVHANAGAKMKDPFADDDDDSEASLSAKPEPSTKATPSIHRQSLVAQSKSIHQPHSQVGAKMKDPFADDDDDDDESTLSARSKPATKRAPILKQASKSVASKIESVHATAGVKVKDPFADDDDDDDEAAASPVKATVRTKPVTVLKQTAKSVSKSNSVHLPEKMKDPFADDDDDDDEVAASPAKTKVRTKPVTVLKQTKKSVSKSNSVNQPEKMKDPFADDDDDDDEVAPVEKSKPALKNGAILQQTAKSSSSGVVATQSQLGAKLGDKMKDPFADDDDADDTAHHETAVVAKTSHSIVALQESNSGNVFGTKAESNDNDLDTIDSEDDTTSSTKGSAAVAAMKQELDVDEAIAEQPSPERMPTQTKAYIGKVVESSPSALPTQYSAWTPTAKATSDQKRKAALEEMGGDLEDDDDAPKPVVSHKTRHHIARTPPPPSPPPPRAPASDGVVYDDDDLPKHRNVVRRLEGGWEAFMKKDAHAARAAPKLDPDVAIMESLYGKDGSLPTQYTAWTPDDVPKPSPPPAAHVNSKDDDDTQGETMDLEAAAKAFAKDPDSAFNFLQIAQDSDESIVNDIISQAAAAPASFRGSHVFLDLSLEASTTKTDLSRMAVATTVLAQYAEVLQSRPLKQLSKAKLNPPKLRALFQQLSNVDPLSSKVSSQARGKQAQAEKMCNYLEAHMQAAAPVQKALSQLQKADNELTTVLASQVAVQEEVEARTQLEKTVAQDVSNLIALKSSGKQRSDSLPSVKGLSVATAADVGASFANIEGANAEVQDLLDAVLQKRQAVLKTQRQKLSQLQTDTKQIVAEVAKNTKTSAASQAEMEAIRKKLSSLSTSCGATLNALARRRHNGHMEAHAIEVALKVLGNQ